MKAPHILAALLIALVLANIGLIAFVIPSEQGIISQLVDKTNTLGTEKMQIQKQLDQQNITLQSYASQISFYRMTPTGSLTGSQSSDRFITGYATLQAPAVSQHIVQETINGFVTQRLAQNGSMMNISVEIRPGQGRNTCPDNPADGYCVPGCGKHRSLCSTE
jgi:transcription initiation factor TFIID subunit TAF12